MSDGASVGAAGAFLTRTGRIWLTIESWLVGPWVGLYRLVRARPGGPADKGEAAGEPVPRSLLVKAQAPFVASMALLAVVWAMAAVRPAGFGTLVTVLACAAGVFALSLAVRNAWVERFAFVAQIVVLDQYFKVLMKHCSHLPVYFDDWLFKIDQSVFGSWPVALGQARSARESEYWALVYSLFILYLFSSLFMNACGRTRRFSGAYIAGITTLYATAYLGYVYLPARGLYSIPELWNGPLPDGPHMKVLRDSFAQTDCFSGAFPSLHVGAVTYMLGNDWLFCRDRFWAYLPLAASIAVSTLTLRMHYFIDLVAGAVLAVACVFLCASLAPPSSSQS